MCGMPRDGIHQCRKYFAHGSRNVRSALNHLRFKDANAGSEVLEKKIKRIDAAALWWFLKAKFKLCSVRCALYLSQAFGKAKAHEACRK